MYSASLEQASCPFVAGARCETTLVVTCDVPFCFCIVPVLGSIWPCEAKTRHSEPAGAKGVHPVSSRLPYTELAYSVIHTSVGTHFAVLKKVEPTRICTLKALVVKTLRKMGRAGSVGDCEQCAYLQLRSFAYAASSCCLLIALSLAARQHRAAVSPALPTGRTACAQHSLPLRTPLQNAMYVSGSLLAFDLRLTVSSAAEC